MPSADPDWKKSIERYFDAAAAAYASIVNPIYRVLAQGLVDAADISVGDQVVDLATGTALAASAALDAGANVIGVDFSAAMLRVARRNTLVDVLRGDIHDLPLRSGFFDLALASFAFNSTDPQLALAETNRVLRAGGRLMLQEWDINDDLSELVSETFAEYMVDDPARELAALRTQMGQHVPWDELETLEDLTEMLATVGFSEIVLTRESPRVVLPSGDAFIQYKLAWPIRAAELKAMPEDIRMLCLSDLRENLSPYANRQTGELVWEPNVVRIRAEKPH